MSDTQTASAAQRQTPLIARSWSDAQVVKAFISQLQTLAPHRNPYQVFGAFTEIAAITIHQSPYHVGMIDKDEPFDRMECAYMDAIKPYSCEELDCFTKLYGIASLALSTYPATDLLGRVFMELDINNKRSGQYFTPSNVTRMMAKMTLCDVGTLIEDKGFITIGESACGSGCMLIEAANELHELGYNPQQVMIFHATDISRDCFNIAYLQLSLMNIPGVVVHGDTLRMEEWERRPTPMFTIMHPVPANPTDETPTRPAPARMADPPPAPPDIQLPGEQLGFNF